MLHKYITLSAEVKTALEAKKAVVALESTIISHGMPYPENKKTAFLLEDSIRKQGAFPATIAILNGHIKIGLSKQEIENFAQQDSTQILKVSTKDIPYVLIGKKNGACTVAATMYLAHLAGICVFATGGIGGVHRGGADSFDISADLDELAKTPVAVVCAGAKSILDIALTLEYLETKSVPVIGYQTNTMPAFYTRTSSFDLDITLDTVQQLVMFLQTKWNLGSKTGVVIANPIPQKYSLEEKYINKIVDEAIKESKVQKIKGKKVTPFSLSYLAEKTEKKSLFSNIELVKNNAELAAHIAIEYQKL